MNPTLLKEFCDQAGIVRPSNRAIHSMYKRRKDVVRAVACKQLRDNRIEHNALIKQTFGTQSILRFVDDLGIEHNFCHSPVLSDDGGETRVYNHRITGHQHCMVVYSCVTGKPLAIKHDQLLCVHCTQKLTDLICLGKRAKDITEDDLKHPGKP